MRTLSAVDFLENAFKPADIRIDFFVTFSRSRFVAVPIISSVSFMLVSFLQIFRLPSSVTPNSFRLGILLLSYSFPLGTHLPWFDLGLLEYNLDIFPIQHPASSSDSAIRDLLLDSAFRSNLGRLFASPIDQELRLPFLSPP